MRLAISTPLGMVADLTELAAIRAQDENGHFGIWPGHAEFMTALETSVVSWRTKDDLVGHCAVRGGVLTIEKGDAVSVATAEAVLGGDIGQLESIVVRQLSEAEETEQQASAQAERLRVEAIRRIVGLLRPESGARAPGFDMAAE
jgi:F-type H+-transporting ATPase subunit epsilon